MNLYEVVFWGSKGDGNAEDTIYLVRASDFKAAVEDVQRNASPQNHNGERRPLAHVVYEVGVDQSPLAEANPKILRGPYFAFAYNCGWNAWERKMVDAQYTNDWEPKPIAP
jgi:hypothetical protein